jgi:lipoate synthase
VPGCRIEVLIPDFKGEEGPLRTVLDAGPDDSWQQCERLSRLKSPGSSRVIAARIMTCRQT